MSSGAAADPLLGASPAASNSATLEAEGPFDWNDPRCHDAQMEGRSMPGGNPLDLLPLEPLPLDFFDRPPLLSIRMRGGVVVRIVQHHPMVMESCEELELPTSVAGPAPGSVRWMVSQDVAGTWWRACDPYCNEALDFQRCHGATRATFHFYPRVGGETYDICRQTYIHDLTRMLQIDVDRRTERPLRRVLELGCQESGRQAPKTARAG